MNLVYGGHHRLNILVRFLKKALGLIRSQVYPKIGMLEAMLKRKVLTRVKEMYLILKAENLL